MKVLILSKHARKGGAAIAAHRLMEALRDHQVEASMLVQDGAGEDQHIFDTSRSRLKKGVNLFRFIYERLAFLRHEKTKSIRFLFSLANTGEKIESNQLVKEADIIHLHWINAGYLSLNSLKSLLNSGKPVVWTLHDMWAFTGGCHYALDCSEYVRQCGNCPYLKKPGSGDLSNRIWRRKEKIFRNADINVITPSQWLNDCVKSSSLMGHNQVSTIYNPVDNKIFSPVEKSEARINLGLDPQKKYILFGAATVGNMLKGFEYFIESVRLLNEQMENPEEVEILLFGKSKGDLSDQFPLKTRHIEFTGSKSMLRDLYSSADLFVIPSLQDNLPNTIIEAMLCGTPVVGYKTGGIPEMIEHRVDGYLAEPRSVNDLASGMKWILESEDSLALSRAAREGAVKRFSRERSAEMHIELYNKLLGEQA